MSSIWRKLALVALCLTPSLMLFPLSILVDPVKDFIAFLSPAWFILELLMTSISFGVIFYLWPSDKEQTERILSEIEASEKRVIDEMKECFNYQPQTDNGILRGSKMSQYRAASTNAAKKFFELIREFDSLGDLSYEELKAHFAKYGADEVIEYCAVLGESGLFEKAVECYEVILESNPDDISALNDRGITYLRYEKPSMALEDLRKAKALQPESSIILNNLGLAYWNLGKTKAAEDSYREALLQTDKYYGVYVNLSTLLRRTSRVDDALNLINEGISSYPDEMELKVELGRVLIEFKEYDQAEQVLNEALEKNDVLPWAYGNLGMISIYRENYDFAVEYYTKAVKLEPENVQFLHNLGISYAEKGDFDEAEEALRKALRLEPKDKETRMNLAALLGNQFRIEEGLDLMKNLYDNDPNSSNTKSLYAIFLALAYELEEMRKVLGLANGEIPRSPSILNSITFGIISRGEESILRKISEGKSSGKKIGKEEAQELVPYLSQLMEIEPNDFANRSFLLRALWHLDEYERALEIINEGLELHPNNEHLVIWKADALMKLGRNDVAFNFLDARTESQSSNPHFCGYYGALLRTRGDFMRAKQYLEKAIKKFPDNEFYQKEMQSVMNKEA